jgi:hypothetical protein
MIALASECLLFRMSSGESVPFSAEMISIELMGETADLFDPEFVKHAASSVFHYFKHELDRETVTVGEFVGALEKVLRGFSLPRSGQEAPDTDDPRVLESDLRALASESGDGCELFFFPRLRDELRAQLRKSPQMLRFRGLRGCVKQLAGARRWSARCQTLHDRIVEFLRNCLSAETEKVSCALLVR